MLRVSSTVKRACTHASRPSLGTTTVNLNLQVRTPHRTFASPSSSTPSYKYQQPSAIQSQQQTIENELAMSSQRRLERIQRLEELQALETLLAQHKAQESQSFLWHMKLHWSKHGPILSAFICGLASMTASFALWKSGYFQQKEKDELKIQLDIVKANQQDVQRRNERDGQQAQELLQRYIDTKTVTVAAPASAWPPSFGWFGRSSTPAATDHTTIQTKTYTASKLDVSKLTQLQKDVQQALA